MTNRPGFELTTPESVVADADAIELTRMWWSRGEPVMSMMPAFDDPGKYGELLAIAARHMAHGYAVRHGHNEVEAYHRILKGLSDVIAADNVQTVAEPLSQTGGNA